MASESSILKTSADQSSSLAGGKGEERNGRMKQGEFRTQRYLWVYMCKRGALVALAEKWDRGLYQTGALIISQGLAPGISDS